MQDKIEHKAGRPGVQKTSFIVLVKCESPSSEDNRTESLGLYILLRERAKLSKSAPLYKNVFEVEIHKLF